MEDVLAIYRRPYDPDFPVVCMDETTKQLTKETRKPQRSEPGMPARYDYEYERHGVCNVFMFFEPFKGKRYVRVAQRRTKIDWAIKIKDLLDNKYPKAKKVVLVMDNLNTHEGASLYETFPPEEARRLLERLDIHHTPKHGSWLNIAEIELRILSGQCLNRRIPNILTLEQEITEWQNQRNRFNTKVDWQFSNENARIKLKRLYPILLT
jgi:hypothetical protein